MRAVSDLLAELPPAWPRPMLARIRRLGRDRTLVILDDDPTGTQTVRGVPVLIDPSTADLTTALARRSAALFILTNSRSLPRARAVTLAERLGRRIRLASRRAGRPVSLVSRSDSTLRGHFPAEVDALAAAAGVAEAPVLFMPFLGEAGRVTIGDVHYLVRSGMAVPVGETEFARDPAFGYRESNLLEWVAARLGAEDPRQVARLPLETIRNGGPAAVEAALRDLPARAIVVANAVDDRDAEVVAAAMAEVERERPILARTAASYVRARAGQPRQPLLEPHALRHSGGPGLVVVGSHVPTTTRQLASLLGDPPTEIEHIEVAVAAAIDPRRRRGLLRDTVSRAAAALERGVAPVVATSRELVPPRPGDPDGLGLAASLSSLLAAVVRQLEPRPAWIIAKGGITSSDVATRGLGARTATVVGPLLSGVPVWRVRRVGARGGGSRRGSGGSSRGSSRGTVLLVVFPGNVGDDDALRTAVRALAIRPRA